MRTGVQPVIAALAAALILFTHPCGCSRAGRSEGPKMREETDPPEEKISDASDASDASDDNDWRETFRDPCTGDWRERWFLDGGHAEVANGPDGMTFSAGPEHGNNAHHAVLWTRQSFDGDLKIEFDYTRLDEARWCVNIIYILATGSGVAPYSNDIHEWRELRRVPGMGMYFRHMNLLHISFAAYDWRIKDETSVEDDYVRARRYLPLRGAGLRGTELEPAYEKTGFFRTGVPHSIAIVKRGHELSMNVRNDAAERTFAWRTDSKPDVREGRVGLRHMFTRSARYANLRISTR